MSAVGLQTELLILPDGNVLVHNLTPEMAGLLTGVGLSDTRCSGMVDERSQALAVQRIVNVQACTQARAGRARRRKATR